MIVDLKVPWKSGCLLSYQQFQMAYVTTDLEVAMEFFSEDCGVASFHLTRDFVLPDGVVIDVALAWASNTNIEIIQPRPDKPGIYGRGLPAKGFGLAFHHAGYLVFGDESWSRLLETISSGRCRVPAMGASPDGLRWLYVNAPGLDHYLEYVMPSEAWTSLMNAI